VTLRVRRWCLAVTALAGVGCGRDVAPGQGRELGAQLRLVVLHGQDVVRAALIHQVAGVLALSMHRICGHDGTTEADLVQEHGQHRDLVRLHLDIDLAQDHAAVAIEGGQQVPAGTCAGG
jgi:hypothetical protein